MSRLSDLKEEYDEARKQHAFWTSGHKCEPGSQTWEEVTARLSAAHSAYELAMREQQGSKTEKVAGSVSEDRVRRVFVIHGRDARLRDGMFSFLKSIGLLPIEWLEAIQLTQKATPYIGEILHAAFGHAQAVVVLITPDDIAKLRKDLILDNDGPHERRFTGQARPNVLFESGMAFATHPDHTVLVEIGKVRPFSDVIGRHLVLMDGSEQKRLELARKLETAGCIIDLSMNGWKTTGDLTPPKFTESFDPAVAELEVSERRPRLASRLKKKAWVTISPISRSTSSKEYWVDDIDDLGVSILLSSAGPAVHLPATDFSESWDGVYSRPKLILTRKYLQGYFPGHEHAREYFL